MTTYATCECGNEMKVGGGCTLTHVKTPGGKYLERIPFGSEERFGGVEEVGVCHDCNCAIGAIHHMGCDWEECPVCHGQALGCEHIHSFIAFEK